VKETLGALAAMLLLAAVIMADGLKITTLPLWPLPTGAGVVMFLIAMRIGWLEEQKRIDAMVFPE
jgi:hypothetical protein